MTTEDEQIEAHEFERYWEEQRHHFDADSPQRERCVLRVLNYDGGRIKAIKCPQEAISELWIFKDSATGLELAVAELRDDDV